MSIPGHWEGDLLSRARTGHIATVVERGSRFVMLVKVTSKDSDGVVKALIAPVAVSTGRRNIDSFRFLERCVQCLRRGFPSEGSSRTPVERRIDSLEVIRSVQAEISGLRKVLEQRAVGVLTRAALHWVMRIDRRSRPADQ